MVIAFIEGGAGPRSVSSLRQQAEMTQMRARWGEAALPDRGVFNSDEVGTVVPHGRICSCRLGSGVYMLWLDGLSYSMARKPGPWV